jgi:hypothetical protein
MVFPRSEKSSRSGFTLLQLLVVAAVERHEFDLMLMDVQMRPRVPDPRFSPVVPKMVSETSPLIDSKEHLLMNEVKANFYREKPGC